MSQFDFDIVALNSNLEGFDGLLCWKGCYFTTPYVESSEVTWALNLVSTKITLFQRLLVVSAKVVYSVELPINVTYDYSSNPQVIDFHSTYWYLAGLTYFCKGHFPYSVRGYIVVEIHPQHWVVFRSS